MLGPQDIEDTILVTHRGCMDGGGCAIMFLAAGGKEKNIRYVAAGHVERFIKSDPVWNSGQFIIFADVGINTPKYSDLIEKHGNCVVLDHHQTSKHMIGRDWANIDMDACGTELLRRYLVEHGLMKEYYPTDAYRQLATIIDDFDRWQLKDNRSAAMADIFTFFGQDRFVKEFRNPELRFVDEQFWKQNELFILEVIGERRREATERCLKKVTKHELLIPECFSVPLKMAVVISSEPHISLIMDAVLNENRDCQLAAMISFDRGMVSLRSKGDVDVSAIASYFGGGGHRGAAGIPLPPGTNIGVIEYIFPGIEEC